MQDGLPGASRVFLNVATWKAMLPSSTTVPAQTLARMSSLETSPGALSSSRDRRASVLLDSATEPEAFVSRHCFGSNVQPSQSKRGDESGIGERQKHNPTARNGHKGKIKTP